MELDKLLDEFGLEDFEKTLDLFFPQSSVSFESLWKEVVSGNLIEICAKTVEMFLQGQAANLGGIRQIFLWLLILGLIGALLTNFVEIFDRSQVADLCFYFLYLTVSALMLRCYYEILSIATEAIENIILFVRLMIPTYLIAVGVASGAATVTVYYEVVIVIIFCVENVFMKVVLPLVSCHMMLSVVNGIWPKERLGLLTDVCGKIISWLLKAGVGVITGLSIVQAMVSPSLDYVQNVALKKFVSVVPGVGDAAKGIMDLSIASAVTVKNSIGAILLILLFLVALNPLGKILIVSLVLKAAAALMGTVSDKRITACANHTADSGFYLLKTAAASMLLFLISLSVVAISTNRY